jgi:hypothetical protein
VLSRVRVRRNTRIRKRRPRHWSPYIFKPGPAAAHVRRDEPVAEIPRPHVAWAQYVEETLDV